MLSPTESRFSAQDRQAMLALARATIAASLAPEVLPRTAEPRPACFDLRSGVFVTIEVAGQLRGCIGVIEPRDTLHDNIVHCARSAAFQDSRFPSLRADELARLEVEISILSELFPIAAEEIEIGRHGLLVTTATQRGLLLPQVAIEHGLSREQFLEETCHKAGLPRSAWREPHTKIYAFTCEVFREGPAKARA
jgi:AmmeMemoRadiSam system protein A